MKGRKYTIIGAVLAGIGAIVGFIGSLASEKGQQAFISEEVARQLDERDRYIDLEVDSEDDD